MIYKGKSGVLQYTEKCGPLSSESLERNLMYSIRLLSLRDLVGC